MNCWTFCIIFSIEVPICEEMALIARSKTKASAPLAAAFMAATIWSVLMNEKPPVKMSMPPQPALTLGIWSEPNW